MVNQIARAAILVGALVLAPLLSARAHAASLPWRDPSQRAVLKNESLEARFQSGLLYHLADPRTGQVFIAIDPAKLPASVAIFGGSGINLDEGTVSQKAGSDTVISHHRAKDGTTWELCWSIEPASGDLILRTEAQSPRPVDQFRVVFPGGDIAAHTLVVVDACGSGRQFHAPWNDRFYDQATSEFMFSPRYVHPLVALFQGESSGCWVEGRDVDTGPANCFAQGQGQTADLLMMRGYPVATRSPAMYEIRFRTYKGDWQDAVDPYVDWMERDVGFVPIDKKPQAWVKNIRSQAYVSVGDFEGLEALARRLDPAKTLLGRMGGFTKYQWDHGYPDYRPTEVAKKWAKRARELGFHVGVHINTTGIDPKYSDLMDRFRKGFMEIKTGPNGKETYTDPPPSHSGRVTIDTRDGKITVWGVPPTIVYSSTANADWRDHLTEQLRPMVEAGVDMIYLDESMAAAGKFLVDGTTAIQGVMALERRILDAYPNVVIETEQINPINARWSGFALTTVDLGHPLGGYIYSRFVKIVPESSYYQPTREKYLDQFQSFGFMYPGANNDESWLQIGKAFQEFELAPASRLPRKDYQLSGFEGSNGATAFYEKHPGKRGLAVYAPGKQPQWFGTRMTNVTSWSGPGALGDWLIYKDDTLLALDPQQTYVFNRSIKLPADKFHITEIPENFALYSNDDWRVLPQLVGTNQSFYKVTFIGNGQLGMIVPDEYLVFLDGQEVPASRQTKTARVEIAATRGKPSVLLAFAKTETQLKGKWVSLPWQTSAAGDSEGFVVAQGDGFFNHVGGRGQIIGKLPQAKSIHLKGVYGMRERPMSLGDGVVRMNGREVLRVPPGREPYQMHPFDVDISAFAGQYVLLEFASEGKVHGPSPAGWESPETVIEP